MAIRKKCGKFATRNILPKPQIDKVRKRTNIPKTINNTIL